MFFFLFNFFVCIPTTKHKTGKGERKKWESRIYQLMTMEKVLAEEELYRAKRDCEEQIIRRESRLTIL